MTKDKSGIEASRPIMEDMQWGLARLERALLFARAHLLAQEQDAAVEDISLALNAVHERLKHTLEDVAAM